MSETELWGVPEDQRGLYGQDFFYGAWLTDTQALLNLAMIEQQIFDLQAKVPQNAKQEESLAKKIGDRQKTLAKSQFVLDTRDQWESWLLEAPPHAHCQWCGRATTLWVRKKARATETVIAGAGQFTDAAAWRHPGQKLGLCPSCGLMVKSQAPNDTDFFGVKRDAKIVRTHPDSFQVVTIGGSSPWWTWPWQQAPALWTHYGKGTSTWSKRYWVHQAEPTWSFAVIHLWVDGQLFSLPGPGLAAVQHDAQTQVAILLKAYADNIPKAERDALSHAFSQDAAWRWLDLLSLPRERTSLIFDCLWIPTADNLKTRAEAVLAKSNGSSPDLKEAI